MQSACLMVGCKGVKVMKKLTVATVAVLAFLLVAPSTLTYAATPVAGNDPAPTSFTRADRSAINIFFGTSTSFDALPAGFKKYLKDNATLPGGRRALMRGRPLAGNLMKLLRPAPKDLMDGLSIGKGSVRVVMIGRNVVLLRSKGNIVLDYVALRLRL